MAVVVATWVPLRSGPDETTVNLTFKVMPTLGE